MSSHFPRSRTSVHVAVALEDKHCNNECSPLLLLLALSFYCWADVIWYGISPLSVWVSCPGYVPSQDLAHLSACWWGDNAGETALMLCEHRLAVAKTLACYQHLSSYQYRALHYEGCYGENALHLRQTQHNETQKKTVAFAKYSRHRHRSLD